jgi:hypothetical protein
MSRPSGETAIESEQMLINCFRVITVLQIEKQGPIDMRDYQCVGDVCMQGLSQSHGAQSLGEKTEGLSYKNISFMYFVHMDSYGKHMPISSLNLLIPFPLLSHPPRHCLCSHVASICPTCPLAASSARLGPLLYVPINVQVIVACIRALGAVADG